MIALDIQKGDRCLTRDGVPVVIVEAWPVCFGTWRAFIGEDDKGRRHFFEMHRESAALRAVGGGR